MKKGKYIILKISVLIFTIITVLILFKVYYGNSDLKYSQEYVAGEGNIKGDVNMEYFSNRGEEFEIGANKYGYAVFKDLEKALAKLKADYKDGILLIQKEFNLAPLSQFNYNLYGTFGWQVTTGSKEEKEQADFVSSFVDIYENSFNKQ